MINNLTSAIKKQPELIDGLNANGLTPLLLAGIMGRRDMLNQLISSGANYKIRSQEDISAEEYLIIFENNLKHEHEFNYLNSYTSMILLSIACEKSLNS